MPVLRLFAAAREVAGVARVDIDGTTVAEMLEVARQRYGDRFAAVLSQSRVWVNGQPAQEDTPVAGRDVVAVIPPVSGGADAPTKTRAGPIAEAGDPDPERTVGTRVSAPDRSTGTRPQAATREQGETPRPRPLSRTRGGGWYLGPDGPEWDPGDRGAPRSPPGPPPVLDRVRQTDGGGDGQVLERLDAPAPERAPSNGLRVETRPRRQSADSVIPGGDAPMARAAEAPPAAAAPTAFVRDRRTDGRPTPKEMLADAGPSLQKLSVVFTTKRPHGRLGLAWAIVVFAAAIGGSRWLAAVLSVAAFVGACQAVSVRRAAGERPVPIMAAATALALPLSAAWGPRVFAMTLGGAVALTVVVCVLFPTRSSLRDIGSTLAIGGLLGLAAASPVLLRSVRLDATLLLLAYAAAYDAGAYLVGTGAHKAWEGPAAGVVALIPVTILSTVVLVPPFPPGGPLLLGALAAVLTPLGPLLGTALVGTRDADVPGLRRVDSLLLLGPLWAAAAAVLV